MCKYIGSLWWEGRRRTHIMSSEGNEEVTHLTMEEEMEKNDE
jgi:hypothetical protein